MSRTYAGYLFRCKVCGKIHLMDSGKPHDGIRLPCVNNKYAVRTYNECDFNFWQGMYWDVFDCLVQEVNY